MKKSVALFMAFTAIIISCNNQEKKAVKKKDSVTCVSTPSRFAGLDTSQNPLIYNRDSSNTGMLGAEASAWAEITFGTKTSGTRWLVLVQRCH